MQPITNPPVPYVGSIRGGFNPGTMVRIQGSVSPTADRFNINLHCGAPPSDLAMHVSVRLLQNYVARNSLQGGNWGTEEDGGALTIAPGQSFEIIILCDPGSYKIAVNGNHFCEFRQRVSFDEVTHLAIDGDVTLTLLAFEAGGASAPAAPPPMAARPEYGGNYGPPPGQYLPPQGQYGPSPYGPSPYGPPKPPGHQEESGFDNFLETAGTLIAGAIASGAARNLISGVTGSGGQGQQQQYQPPPPPPPPQQPMFPFGGQGSVGGLGSVGSLLETFAGQMLGPKKHQMTKLASNQPPPINMPMPASVPLPPPSAPSVPSGPPPAYMPPGAPPAYMPPLPTATSMYASHPPLSQLPPYIPPPAYVPPPMPISTYQPRPAPAYPVQPPAYRYPVQPPAYSVPGSMYAVPPANMQMYGSQPAYPTNGVKKSKLKQAMKYGLPIAGVGLGAYAISHALNHSGSSSDSD